MSKKNILVSLIMTFVTYSLSAQGSVNADINSDPEAGNFVARSLSERYSDVSEHCGDDFGPAYLCSGIILRGVHNSTKYNSWEPSPASVKSGGVSFSYLRKDINLDVMSTANGFVFFNKSYAPDHVKKDIEVLCFFPLDGWTDYRNRAGCGESPDFPDVSKECKEQGIFNAEQWLTHYKDGLKYPGAGHYKHQCGFLISSQEGKSGTNAFNEGIKARKEILNSHNMFDELRLATWSLKESKQSEHLPIQAFFYVPNQNSYYNSDFSGLKGAQYDQQSYYKQTGIWIPIIFISFDKKDIYEAKFDYLESDQKVMNTNVVIPDATGTVLRKNDYYRLNNLSIDVPSYPGMEKGDVVTVRFAGPRNTYESNAITVDSVKALHFEVPRVEFIDAIGETAAISFSVSRKNGSDVKESRIQQLDVEGQDLKLEPPVISEDAKKIIVKYEGMSSHHYLSFMISGVETHFSELLQANDSGEFEFEIPDNWLAENKGREIKITYAVGDDKGSKYQFSKVFRVKNLDF